MAVHANAAPGAVYDRKRNMEAYARRAYPLYRRFHVQRAMAMVLTRRCPSWGGLKVPPKRPMRMPGA